MYRKSRYLKIKKLWLEHREWLAPLLLFCLAAALFTYWLSAPNFKDPDSFYHLKIADLMTKRKAAIVDFPWLKFTTLGEAYVDHHFLYHLFLIPFILILPPITGMKVATVVLAASTVALFTIFLQSQRVRYAPLFTLILLFSQPFAFRMGLSKAPSVAFLFLVGGFWLLATKRYGLLTILSFFFVWSYGGFALLPILATIFVGISIVRHFLLNRQWPQKKDLFNKTLPVISTYTGTIAGLLIHPSFPQHLNFYWQQVIQIGLINYSGEIGVGAEWYPMQFTDLAGGVVLTTGLLVISLIATIFTLKKQTVASLSALVMNLIFFLFTLKSQRYIEYYLPWTLIFSALSLQASGWLDRIPELLKSANRNWFRDPLTVFIGSIALFYTTFIVPSVWMVQAQATSNGLRVGVPVDDFAGAGAWLRGHATKGDVVFHSNWDIFPQMFYQVARVRYIAGLDPTFLYNKDPELYYKWRNVTTGETKEGLLEIIQGDFDARFVIIESDHEAMMRNIINDGNFKLVYEDEDYTIFRVPRPQQTETAPTEEQVSPTDSSTQ